MTLAAGFLICAAVDAPAQISQSGQDSRVGLHEALVRELGFTAADLDAVSRGEIVPKVLPTQDARDVAVVAVARVSRTSQATATMQRGNAHPFSRPASLADVQEVRVTRDDVDELRKCQPSACNFKLPASDMVAVRAVIDSTGADPADAVTTYVRQRMVDYANAYRKQGAAAMVVYQDLGSVQSRAAFDSMVQDSSRLFRVAPALAHYLDVYPQDSLAGATSTILWSVDQMPRLRPVMRVMQRVVYQPAGDPATTFVVSKQLYADHYFEAGLEALVFTDAANAGLPGAAGDAVIVATRRYRFDHLPSGGLLNIRGRVISALRNGLADDLKQLRDGGK